MNAQKVYFGLIAILVLLIGGIGTILYFGNNLLQSRANKLVEAKLDSSVSEELERSYIKASKDLETYKNLGETLALILPKDKDQARAVRELYKIADETNISIDSIRFPNSTLGQKIAAAPAASGSTATPTTPATSTITQAKPVDGIQGVQGIDIDISAIGRSGNTIPYDNMIRFLQGVELNRRSMQVKRMTVSPSETRSGVTFTATLTIFIKP